MKCLFGLIIAIFLTAVPTLAQETLESSVSRGIMDLTAVDEKMPQLGLTLGVFNPDKEYRRNSIYGLQFGLKTRFGIMIGAEALRTVTESQRDVRDRTLLMFNTTLTNSNPRKVEWYAGLGVGLILDTVDKITFSAVGGHPFVGVDVPLGAPGISRNSFSLGVRIGYLATTDHSYGADFVGTVKYWL